MSIRTLCIWIIVAGILGAGVLVSRARQAAELIAEPTVHARTLGFEPGEVVGLVVSDGDRRQILERDAQRIDQWIVHWSMNGLNHSWGVSSPKVRGGLRALATASLTLSDKDMIHTIGSELIIDRRDMGSIRIEFDAQASGGYRAVRIDERDLDGHTIHQWFGRLDDALFDRFVVRGMLDWRDSRLFEIAGSAVQGVELETSNARVLLERNANGWNIQEPVVVHGNNGRIDDLVKSLIVIDSSSFVDDDIQDSTTGLDSPLATIVIWTNKQAATLTIGSRADVEGAMVYARIDSSVGNALVTLESKQLAQVTAVVDAYLSKLPSPVGAGAVVGIRILGRDGIERFSTSRSAGEWTIADQPADSVNRDAIERLLSMLTREESPYVRIFEGNDAPTAMGSVELIGRDGLVIGRMGVGLDTSEAEMKLLMLHEMDSGQFVLWANNSESAIATGAWLTAVTSKRRP